MVTMACRRPSETCFCGTFGNRRGQPAGDVTCWMDDEQLYWRANTPKGEALTESLSCFADGGEEAVAAQQEAARAILAKLPLAGLRTEGFGGEHMMELFASPKWAELSESCWAAAPAPSCARPASATTFRSSKTARLCAASAAGTAACTPTSPRLSAGQPRPTQLERFRQRFMHKLVYYPANNEGIYSCVGCGRCLQKCPIHMNIVKVMKALGEEQK